MKIEQFAFGDRLSVKLKVKFSLVELRNALGIGETWLTTGGVVSMVKFLVPLVFVLPA